MGKLSSSMMRGLSAVLLLTLLAATLSAAPLEDLITSRLPGNIQYSIDFKQYAGYLQSADTHFLFYWLVESQSDPVNDPVVLWLNGGPGCSSLDGLLSELGPFWAQQYGQTLVENPYAWNKAANVIFLESPVGVGFSYAEEGYANMTWNDDITAQENYAALYDFFTYKFPEYRQNEFFIAGESYAGIYVPTLAELVANDKMNFPNFKGIAIGDGVLNYPLLVNTVIPYNYYHLLFSEQLWQNISAECCDGNPGDCDYYSYLSAENASLCQRLTVEAYLSSELFFDPYFLYYTCYLPDWEPQSPEQLLATARSPVKRIRSAVAKHAHLAHTSEHRGAPEPACAHHNDSTYYLQRPDVRRVLNVRSQSATWESCSNNVSNNYVEIYTNVTQQIQNLIDLGVRVLIYNGDVDTVCNAIGNARFVHDLGREPLGKTHRAWHYEYSLPDTAGYVSQYEGIDFLSLHGSGHFVPSEKPREALQMIVNFLRNTGNYSQPTGIDVEPNIDADYCHQKYQINPWQQAEPATLCGHNPCIVNKNGPTCVCYNGLRGDYCNEWP